MDEQSGGVFAKSKSVITFDGDPFVGVPVDRTIVEEVAAEYDCDRGNLARALREVEKNPVTLDHGTLFSSFDPEPVGSDGDGHLYLILGDESLWDVVADHIQLTDVGRRAVAAAHDRHVRKHGAYQRANRGVGVVVPCPKFPSAVIPEIQTLTERTGLTARQATVSALEHRALNLPAIADVMGVSETVVESELAAVQRETRRVRGAARILDSPQKAITRLKPNPTSDDWLGLEWSPWFDLRDRDRLLDQLPPESGLYRVRNTEWSGLLYVGESGSAGGVRDRVGHGLADGFDAPEPPVGGNHDATERLWRVARAVGGTTEVSVATPAIAANRRHRRGLEAALVAVCRRETGRTPDAMLNRTPVVNEQRASAASPEERPSAADSLDVPDWTTWRRVTAPDWMGIDWSDPRPLTARGEVGDVGPCAIRVWERREERDTWDRTLNTIGTTESSVSRLFQLENEYGPEYVFSIAPLRGLSADSRVRSRQFEEARYDLVGAHYLATGEPPADQY